MEDYSRYVILSSLDNRTRLLMFTVPEVLALFIPIVVGLLMGGFLGILLFLSSYWCRKLYLRWQRLFPPSVWGGMMYWYTPSHSSKKPPFPASHIREYIS